MINSLEHLAFVKKLKFFNQKIIQKILYNLSSIPSQRLKKKVIILTIFLYYSTLEKNMILIGGDGRFYTPEAINIILRMCVANNIDEVHIPIKGLISTPGISGYIRKFNYQGPGYCIGAFDLTASHNPGGAENDFGIKFNIANGGPAPEDFTGRSFDISKSISEYHISTDFTHEINVSVENTIRYDDIGRPQKPQFVVKVVSSARQYTELMRQLFDFE